MNGLNNASIIILQQIAHGVIHPYTILQVSTYIHVFTKNHRCFKCHFKYLQMFKPNMATVILQIGMSLK